MSAISPRNLPFYAQINQNCHIFEKKLDRNIGQFVLETDHLLDFWPTFEAGFRLFETTKGHYNVYLTGTELFLPI